MDLRSGGGPGLRGQGRGVSSADLETGGGAIFRGGLRRAMGNSCAERGRSMGREAELSAAPRYVEDPSTCYFYQSMEQPGFGLQRGEWDLRGRFDEYIGHVDLAGARVLDVGCASGYLSFSAERSGVADVYSFD